MPKRVVFPEPVNERDSWEVDCAELTKPDGTPLGPLMFETLRLWLYDITTDTIINSINGLDIKNTGRGVLDVNGHLVIGLESDDGPIITASSVKEKHRGLVLGKWNSGKGQTTLEFEFTVKNTHRVP